MIADCMTKPLDLLRYSICFMLYSYWLATSHHVLLHWKFHQLASLHTHPYHDTWGASVLSIVVSTLIMYGKDLVLSPRGHISFSCFLRLWAQLCHVPISMLMGCCLSPWDPCIQQGGLLRYRICSMKYSSWLATTHHHVLLHQTFHHLASLLTHPYLETQEASVLI